MIIDILSILFFVIVFGIFMVVPRKLRRVVLLVSSCIYIGLVDLRALTVLLITTFITYIAGIAMEAAGGRSAKAGKLIYVISIGILVLVLVAFKYAAVAGDYGIIDSGIASALAIPVGFSFYVLGAIAYLSGINRGERKAQRSMVKYFLYMSWFPKFVSGPIEDENRMDNEFEHATAFRLSADTVKIAALRMAYGMFLKLVVADRLGIYVDDLYSNMNDYGSIALFVGTIFYSAQIYCDFAGYTYFARGVSRLFGIELSENFVTPYFACNISEFWSRWHMTLSTWLKNNIYIPLGGNRKGEVRKAVNLMIVFIVSGFWHGATASFLIWGALHGIYSILNGIFKRHNVRFMTEGTSGRIINFLAVTWAWIFFRASSAAEAFGYIKAMFTNGIRLWYLGTHFRESWRQFIDPAVTILLLILVLVIDIVSYKKKKDITEIISEKGTAASLIFIYMAIILTVIFGIYGASIFAKTYIYMQF